MHDNLTINALPGNHVAFKLNNMLSLRDKLMLHNKKREAVGKETQLHSADLADYQTMFNLSLPDLTGFILDIGAGFSSFNAEMTAYHHRVVSLDALYKETPEALSARIEKIASGAALSEKLGLSADIFLSDYSQESGRYCELDWDDLPQVEQPFTLALCYGQFFDASDIPLTSYVDRIVNILSIAHEMRIMLLSEEHGAALAELMQVLLAKNFLVELTALPYGGSSLLSLQNACCELAPPT